MKLFEQEFTRFHAGIEATVPDAAKSQWGFRTIDAADDALRILENRMNELELALVEIHRAIKKARS